MAIFHSGVGLAGPLTPLSQGSRLGTRRASEAVGKASVAAPAAPEITKFDVISNPQLIEFHSKKIFQEVEIITLAIILYMASNP